MKVTPFEKIICRTPVFGINQTLEEVWEELKLKIEESSSAFYEIIKKLKVDNLSQLDDKTKFTIWKYYNRSIYRSTPFASFGAITLIPLSFTTNHSLLLKKAINSHHLLDWSEKEKHNSIGINDARYLLTNSSVYFVDQEIRYIKTNNGQFELAAVGALPELNTILLTCKRKTTIETVLELMKYSFDLDDHSITAILEQLIELQLLHTDLQPNITGEDYFSKLQIPCPTLPNNYIIAERELQSGNYNGKTLKHLPELTEFFTKTFSPIKNTDLNNFKKFFLKRFENQEVNLAMVMDPEIGIGYGDLAQLNSLNPLVDEIKASKREIIENNISYGKLQQFLLRHIIDHEAIDLADFKEINKETASLANTFSLIFHLFEGQPVLAHSGGCTANALLGRFSMNNKEMENYCNKITDIELKANEDVLFFDIAYQAEKKVDNVNRRKQLYPYELPILTWSDTASPLDLTDILVSVVQNEVVLKSKKLGKRLIPRVASAYNYTRSDLAVYRFLCDIQSQGLLTNLSFKLQDFFPNLNYYPRVSYKGIVVSPEMWLLPADAQQNIHNLQLWLQRSQIKELIKVGHSDQSLTFNPNKEEDVWALRQFCKQQNRDIYLTAALLDEKDLIKDENGNTYLPQYIVNYHHKDQLYRPSEPQINEPLKNHLPGTEWLYFEIYCHPNKSNYLLTGLITKFIKTQHKHFKKWFFIRYSNPKPHLRLRLNLKDKAKGFELMDVLQKLISTVFVIGFVSDFKVKTYQKETQRYGAKRIDLVEDFFKADSEYALHLIQKSKDEHQLMINTLFTLINLLNCNFKEIKKQVQFVKEMCKHFAKEMNLGAANFKQINGQFNSLKSELMEGIIHLPVGLNKKHQEIFKAVLNNCESDLIKQKMLGDLIHMHINRLFITDQRVHETIIYHYLSRILQAKLATLKLEQGL